MFAGFSTSPKLAHALVTNFMDKWNIKTGIAHRFEKDFGHYDYVLLENIALLEHELTGQLMPGLRLTADFVDTGETFLYSRAGFDMPGEEHLEPSRIPNGIDDVIVLTASDPAHNRATDGTAREEAVVAISNMMRPLCESDRWLAARCGLVRPAFVSRAPTEAEWNFTKALISKLAMDGYNVSTKKFRHGFLKRWTNACMRMSNPNHVEEELGIGILTTMSCDRFLERYKDLLSTKASYASLRAHDETLRKELRSGARATFRPARRQGDRCCGVASSSHHMLDALVSLENVVSSKRQRVAGHDAGQYTSQLAVGDQCEVRADHGASPNANQAKVERQPPICETCHHFQNGDGPFEAIAHKGKGRSCTVNPANYLSRATHPWNFLSSRRRRSLAKTGVTASEYNASKVVGMSN